MKSVLVAMFLILISSAANAGFEVEKWRLRGMQGKGEATTEDMITEVKKQINSRCESLGTHDTVELLSEVVVREDVQTIYRTRTTNCDQDLPCSTQYTPVGTHTDRFRSSDLVLRRKNRAGEQYLITIKTYWDYDLPMPKPDASQITSTRCF